MQTESSAPVAPPAHLSDRSELAPILRCRWQYVACSVATAAMMVLAYPNKDQDYLIWFALVPFILAARGLGGRRGFFYGWMTGALIEGFGFFWICTTIQSFTDEFFESWSALLAPLLFAVWLSFSTLTWAAFGWLLGRTRRPAGAHVAMLVWIAVEQYFPRLFPWHVGGALYDREWLRQGADLLGSSGLSSLVLLVSTTLYLLIEWRAKRAAFPRVSVALTVILALFANVYGALRLGHLDARLRETPELHAGVIQPFMAPGIKHTGDRPKRFRQFGKLIQESLDLVASDQKSLAFICWPEGMSNIAPFDARPGKDPLSQYTLPGGGTPFDTVPVPLIVGGASFGESERPFGTMAYILPKDSPIDGVRTRLYHKNIRLLFGERAPLEGYLPQWILDNISQGSLEPGTENPLFPLEPVAPAGRAGARYSFRNLVCYEATLPGYVRKSAAQSDFLVNISEDYWYGDTDHIGQHESVLRLRCVENRVPIVRCTNVGPSGCIDVTGRFEQRTGAWRKDRKVVSFRPVSFFSLYRAGAYCYPALAAVLALAVFVRLNFRKA